MTSLHKDERARRARVKLGAVIKREYVDKDVVSCQKHCRDAAVARLSVLAGEIYGLRRAMIDC